MRRITAIAVLWAGTAMGATTQLGLLGVMTLGGTDGVDRGSLASPNPYSGNTSFGGGVMIRGAGNPFFNLELNALYAPRKYAFAGGGQATFPMLEIPLMLRFTPIPLLAFGFGGYYAVKIGDVSTTGTLPAAYNPPTFGTHDYGLVGAAGLQLPFGPMMAFLLEARFLMGLADLDPSLVGVLKVRQWEFVGGFLFKIP